jgi:hypothetical protein
VTIVRTALAASLGFVLSGCAEGHDLALDRASREYDCPRNKMRVKWLGSSRIGEVYRVDGCGIVVTYACDEMREQCIKESDDRRERD